ncbi:MAG: hypothetical protein ACI4K7_05125, partial [Oscillospiraceae bacterium]
MLYLLIISWLLSPLVLIPLTIVQCRKKEKLHRFVSELLQKDRIDYMEYSELRVRNEDTAACPPSSEAEAPIFCDAEKHNSILKEPARQPYTYHEYTPAAPKPGFMDESAVHSDKRSENAAPASPEKRTGKKGSAGAMSVLMTIGIIFVILAGVVFSTAVWVNLGNFGRACAIGIVSALFFGISAFAKRKLSLDSTAFAFYTLGSFFAAITLITAGFFRLMGSYLSVDGGGNCILFAIAALIISLFSAKGRSVFNKAASAYITVFSGAIAAILLIIQFSDNAGMFALLTALLSLVVNTAVFAADLKISDNWEKPVRAASAMVYAVALICGIVSVFTEQTAVYACAAVYVIRSAAAAFMGFKGHRIYKKQFPAAVSLISGIFFSTVLMWKLSGSLDIFALALTIFAIAFTGGFFTFKINVPDEWNGPVKLSAALLNTAALLSAFAALFGSFGEWNGVCYAISALYILQSIAVTAMAFKGHHVYSKCGWAAFAHFTGILFSAFLLFELAPHERCFILLLAVLAVSYTIAADIAFMKIPEGWLPVTKVSKVILNIAGAFFSAALLIEYNADWDIYCIITAALYIAYTAFFGIRYEKKLLTAAECIISSFSLFNLYCLIVNRYENSPVLILVSMLFGAALIHHFAKPVRTAFSDIFLTAAVIIAALYSTSDDSIFALIGFAVLGILLLINSAERERSLSGLFGALLPLPVSGIVFTAIEMADIYFPFSYCTAANAAVLAAIAAAMLILTKRSGAVFYSFAVTASVMVLLGTDSGSFGIQLLLIAVSVLLTVLFGISANDLPSLLS